MIPESYSDQIERVRQMAAGDGTWDLSMNDVAALKALLSRVEEQERELVRLREGWVSVKDRLPKVGTSVWGWCAVDGGREMGWDGSCWRYWGMDAFDNMEWIKCEYPVTHWMPLPAPPRPFTSQEVYEGIPDLVAKAEEMEKQGVPEVF